MPFASTLLASASLLLAVPALPSELAPAAFAGSHQPLGRYSDRTLVLAVVLDRDQATLVSYTVKQRPFLAPPQAAPARSFADGQAVQAEVVLLGPEGTRYTRRIDLGPLCLEHAADEPGHVDGDTVRLHRDSFLVELPELEGFDAVEVAYHAGLPEQPLRIAVGYEPLDRARFSAAGGRLGYDALAFAAPGSGPDPPPPTSGQVHWPEEYGDPELYAVYGDASEVDRRINVVIVPDGYTYAEKATMQAHAASMVGYFRGKTPYKEHDPFLNYILVYAYSNASGTDQCDCDLVVDTAMNTRFPDPFGQPCGNSANRCLYYGTGNGGPSCDPTTSSANISAAELRAPARDTTVVMVNTTRYGGCGGLRAVYAAAASSAADIAVHELGHSLAGLADEYVDLSGCGPAGSGYNWSEDGNLGSWPEWIGEIGAPRTGARRYPTCVYRPEASCDMRSLNQPFCRVCNQRWALVFFGHPNVAPTAPVASQSPASPLSATPGEPVTFAVAPRLAAGPGVLNQYTWSVNAPGGAGPLVVSTTGPTYQHTFTAAGPHTVECELVADANFIKPSKYGANVDVASWAVSVLVCDPPPLFAGIAGAADRDPCAPSGIELVWDPAAFGPRGGDYQVFRDGLLVATGVAASPWLDQPGDEASHDYRVQAVSADCAVADGNAVTASATDLGSCCDPVPVFAGLASASDLDPCAATGIRLTWDPATFGPAGGSYRVWRDGSPVAAGLTASPFNDQPGDEAQHAYRVEAVSADCAIGDGNNISVIATDAGRCCDPAPVFAGLAAARDLDPCAATGVELSWPPASFGPAGGSYQVWRDATLVASGVSASPHVDLPGDEAVHDYRVAAISADCATADGNTTSLPARDGGATPVPLGNVARLVRTARGLLVTWSDLPGADSYHVARSAARDFAEPRIIVGYASSGAAGIEDTDDLTGPGPWTYRVAQESCGQPSGY